MERDTIIIFCIIYIALIMISGVIYDTMYWWDRYRHRYIYIAMLFWIVVFSWLLVYHPLKYIYNKFYKIKW